MSETIDLDYPQQCHICGCKTSLVRRVQEDYTTKTILTNNDRPFFAQIYSDHSFQRIVICSQECVRSKPDKLIEFVKKNIVRCGITVYTKSFFEATRNLTLEEVFQLRQMPDFITKHDLGKKTGVDVLIDFGVKVSSTPLVYLEDVERAINTAAALPLPDDLRKTVVKMAL